MLERNQTLPFPSIFDLIEMDRFVHMKFWSRKGQSGIITMFFSGGGKKSRSQKGGGSVGKETKDVITHIPITSDPESFH